MSITVAEIPLGVAQPLFRIYALGEGDDFPIVDFLETLNQSDTKSYDRLMALLKSASERGPNSHDKTKCRQIKGIKEPIFELKTKLGDRVLWFYDTGRMVLCTNAFKKPPENVLKQEIQKSIVWYRKYTKAKADKKLTFE